MDRIVLDRFMRVGDRVTMKMDEEARSWGRKALKERKELTD